MTSATSTRPSLLPSTSSPEGSPASLCRPPESDEAMPTPAGSGPLCDELSRIPGPVGWLLRTCVASSRWGTSRCALTWKKKVTTSGRLFYLLSASTRRTAESASGLWPTPQASPNQNRDTQPKPSVVNGTHGWSLAGAAHDSLSLNPVRLWPTPSANEMRTTDPVRLLERREQCKATATNGNGFGLTLGNAITLSEAGLWPTPTSRDHKDGTNVENVPVNGLLGRAVGPTKQSGALNPRWVEWLMGYPDGWTDLGPSATPSSPRSRS